MVKVAGSLSTALILVTAMADFSIASTVRQQQYDFQYGDTVKPITSDVFTVCEVCRADTLHKMPKPFVAIRLSPSVDYQPMIDEPVSKEPEVLPREEAAEEGGLLDTVLFKFGSDKLSREEKQKLDEVAKGLTASSALKITGYTCTVGAKGYNMKLSERRAKVVAAYLRSKKVKVAGVEAKGECCPVSPIKKLNRRVEVEK